MVTDEAEAVLYILDGRAEGRTPDEADWQRLFATEGYRRLQQREASLERPFQDSAFREFVLSADLLARAPALRRTLRAWTRVDPASAARRAFAHLPAAAVIRAKVYPVIKPRTNSFVFEPRTNPAIFLYLDPKVTPAKLENTVTHELHHIGVASACPDDPRAALPENVKNALDWMGGFAEGRAVLAAAGSPDVHPHATSDAAERAVWDRDVAQVARDFERLESFFVSLLDEKLDEGERTAGHGLRLDRRRAAGRVLHSRVDDGVRHRAPFRPRAARRVSVRPGEVPVGLQQRRRGHESAALVGRAHRAHSRRVSPRASALAAGLRPLRHR